MRIKLLHKLLRRREVKSNGNVRHAGHRIVLLAERISTSLMACINAILSTVVLAPYYAVGKDGRTHAEAQRLLDSPDRWLPWSEWLRALLWGTLRYGNGYALLEKDSSGRWELLVVHPRNVTPIFDDWDRIIGYDVVIGTKRKTYIEREVVHVPFWLPSDRRGVGTDPTQVLRTLLAADEAVWRYIAATLDNFGAPAVLYTYSGTTPLSPAEVEELRDMLREGFRLDRTGGVAVVGFPMEVKQLGTLPTGNFSEFLYAVEAAISAMYRVPAQVAGLTLGYRFSTYSNYENAILHFLQNTVSPIHTMVEWQLYKVLSGVYTDLSDISADLSAYPILANERWAQANALGQLYQLGVLSLQEVRQSLGFTAQMAEAETASDTGAEGLPEEKSDALYWKEWDDYWQRMYVRMLRALREVAREYRQMVREFLGRKTLEAVAEQKTLVDTKTQFTLEGLLTEFAEAVKARVSEVAERYLRGASEKAALAVRRWVRNPAPSLLEEAMRSGVEEVTRKTRTGIENFARHVATLVWQSWGKPDVDIAHEIEARFDEFNDVRARRIARTGTTAGLTRTQKEVWSKLGESSAIKFRRYWISMRDDRVRDSHRAMDGKPEDDDGFFTLPSGLRGEGPGLFDDPGETVNCRCTTRPRRE